MRPPTRGHNNTPRDAAIGGRVLTAAVTLVLKFTLYTHPVAPFRRRDTTSPHLGLPASGFSRRLTPSCVPALRAEPQRFKVSLVGKKKKTELSASKSERLEQREGREAGWGGD